MSGNFGHFFFGAEMDGECGGVFGEEDGKPLAIFAGLTPAEASLNRYWEIGGFLGVLKALNGEIGGLNHGSATTGFVDMLVWAAKVQIYAGKSQRSENLAGG